MNGLSRILVLLTALLVSVWVPLASFSVAAVKFRYITSIYADEKGMPLKQPEGVASNDKSILIVADTGNRRLLRYTFQDRTVEPGVVEFKVDQLTYPIKTKINSKGEIYVLDRKQRQIIRMTPEGVFKDYLEPVGLPSPPSYVPRSFTIDRKDNIYVLDILSGRVLVLDPEGRYQKQISSPKEHGFFSDVAVDFRGNVLLVDSVNGVVFSAPKNSARFSPLTESLKEYTRFPASLTTDYRGRIYLVDRNGGSIVILGQDGTFLERKSGFGWKEGRLNYPSQMCINSKGEIFIADTNNNRLQIFTTIE
jgi:DNA-binding beta-propeller fold protein YncE